LYIINLYKIAKFILKVFENFVKINKE